MAITESATQHLKLRIEPPQTKTTTTTATTRPIAIRAPCFSFPSPACPKPAATTGTPLGGLPQEIWENVAARLMNIDKFTKWYATWMFANPRLGYPGLLKGEDFKRHGIAQMLLINHRLHVIFLATMLRENVLKFSNAAYLRDFLWELQAHYSLPLHIRKLRLTIDTFNSRQEADMLSVLRDMRNKGNDAQPLMPKLTYLKLSFKCANFEGCHYLFDTIEDFRRGTPLRPQVQVLFQAIANIRVKKGEVDGINNKDLVQHLSEVLTGATELQLDAAYQYKKCFVSWSPL